MSFRYSSTLFLLLKIWFKGVTYPSVAGLWSKWAPPLERSGLMMFASAGSYFGTVIALPLSALLAEAFGWRSIFWFFGKTMLCGGF